MFGRYSHILSHLCDMKITQIIEIHAQGRQECDYEA